MAQTIKLKRSAVAAKEPGTGDLALGELAINTYDGKMYFKKDSGTASIVRLANIGEVVTLTGTQNVGGAKTFSDITTVSNTTASSSTTTGALVVSGGVGVAKSVRAAEDSYFNEIIVGRGGGNNVSNTAIGFDCLANNTDGVFNTAVGNSVMANCVAGSYNAGFGWWALVSADSGSSNSGFGFHALRNTTDGSANIGIGAVALYNNNLGNYNIGIGYLAGTYHANGTTALTDPEGCVYIGAECRGKDNSDSNSVVIAGRTATARGISNGANTTTIGNSETTGTFIPAGNLTLSNGNLVLGTAGNGISFAATTDPTIPAVAATGWIARTATNVANNDTVTIGTTVYTFKTTLTPANYEVLIGADAAASLTNLRHAILGTGGTPGTDYQVPAAHPTVTADAINGVYLPLQAITAGAAGNSIALAETSAELSVSYATLRGGRDAQGSSSEILADYEEGTWTPRYSFTGAQADPGSIMISSGTYTKVGRIVIASGEIRTDALMGGTGDALISGLPFTAGSQGTVSVGRASTFVGSAGDFPTHGIVSASSTSISFYKRTTSNFNAAFVRGDLAGNYESHNSMAFTAFYFT